MAMNRQRRTSNIANIFSYDDAGNIVIKDYGQVTRYSWNGLIHGFVGPVSVSSVSAATTDTDRFLVSDGGVLKYRTGVELLSDIGGVPSTRTLTINGVTQDLSADRSFTIPSANIYNSDGTLTGNRTLTTAGNTLAFRTGGVDEFLFTPNNGSTFPILKVYNATYGGKLDLGYGYFQVGGGALSFGNTNSGNINIFAGTQKAQLFGGTGNLLIQTGGTFTDAGYKLDVQGSARVKGDVWFDSNDAGQSVLRVGSNTNVYFTVNSLGSVSAKGFQTNAGNTYINADGTMMVNSSLAASSAITVGEYTPGGNFLVFRGQYTVPFMVWSQAGLQFGNNASAVASALVELNSTTKGFLQPRMTTTERNAIVSPATGLQIYNTTTLQQNTYNGTSWVGEGNVGGSGADGQVAYWNGTSSQTGSNNLFWDNANRSLGIGTNTPSRLLEISTANGGTDVILARFRAVNAQPNVVIEFASSTSVVAQIVGLTNFSGLYGLAFRSSTTEVARFTNTNNFLIGGTSDGGQRLQVQGDAFIKGTGTTSATSALLIQNSAGNNTFQVRNAGGVLIYDPSGNQSLQINGNGGSQGIAIGSAQAFATASGGGAVAVGATATASGGQSVSLGQQSTAAGEFGVAIGYLSVASSQRGIAIGFQSSTAGHVNSITLNGQATASGQFVAGTTGNITEVYFGSGPRTYNTNGTSYTINGSGGATGISNTNGGNITIAGGKGVGNGTAGDVIISTATPTTSGSTLQTLTERIKVFGATGNVVLQNGGTFLDGGFRLDVNGTSRFSDKLSVIATATTNDVALFRSVEPYVTIEAVGASNPASIFFRPSTSAQNATIQNRTGGGIDFYTGGTPSLSLAVKSSGSVVASSTLGLNGVEDSVKGNTYTPTLTDVSNITSSSVSSDAFRYIRIGSIVYVSGRITVSATSANTATEIEISLPIASNLTSSIDLSGVATTPSNGYGQVIGDTTADTASFYVFPTSAGSSPWNVEFSYVIK